MFEIILPSIFTQLTLKLPGYAAAQNIWVAARAAGVGAAYTTLHIHARDQIEKLLELPKGTNIEVTIPLGYPLKPFGPVNRKHINEVSSWNSFIPK